MGHPGLRHIYTTRVPERKAKIAAVAQPDPMLTCIRVTVAAPRVRGAWLQSRDDIDHDRSIGGNRLLECRGDLARPLDTDTAHTEAAGDSGKIGRSEADQCLAAVQTIAGNPVHAGQVLAEAGIVVDDDHNRDVVAACRVVRNNRIAVPPADGFADRLHGVQGKAPLDNKAPSSDNSSACVPCFRRVSCICRAYRSFSVM